MKIHDPLCQITQFVGKGFTAADVERLCNCRAVAAIRKDERKQTEERVTARTRGEYLVQVPLVIDAIRDADDEDDEP